MITIEPLTAEIVERHGNELISLNDADWDYWTKENLAADLPGKWQHSLIAYVDSNISGYAIASRTTEGIHLHHIVIAASLRSLGLGRILIARIAIKAAQEGARIMTLKVYKTNTRAICLYESLGFRTVDNDRPDLQKMFANLSDVIRNVGENAVLLK